MKRARRRLILLLLCVSAVPAVSLDREAFTFTRYDLDVRVEPEQQRLGVRGTITLRNDAKTPQKNVVLQISSSLTWRSIRLRDQLVQFVSQPFTSDVDHTGELSEAIVSLPKEIAPGGSVDLAIAYEGVVVPDAGRLTRIGLPKETALHSDWDRIGPSFSGVRGAGYVLWYPVALDAASLSDPNAVFEAIGRWQRRNAESKMDLVFGVTSVASSDDIHFSGTPNLSEIGIEKGDTAQYRAFSTTRLGRDAPTFVIAHYESLPAAALSSISYLPNSLPAAREYVDLMKKIDAVVRIGRNDCRLKVLDLPDTNAAPFATGDMLILPMRSPIALGAELAVVRACAGREIPTHQAWIQEGAAGYAAAEYLLQTDSRGSALQFLQNSLPLLVEAENATLAERQKDSRQAAPDSSLFEATSDIYLQTKSMYVFWMLRDMLGGLSGKLLSYEYRLDADPASMQHMLEKLSARDLQWFFDDWVYHDRGLPDFRIAAFFPRRTEGSNYVSTVTVENLGGAGAEVPVTVNFDGGEVTKRLEVRGKATAVVRIETPKAPVEVVVNDGSVPESDMSNNAFRPEAKPSP
jgi:hypothetical protein